MNKSYFDHLLPVVGLQMTRNDIISRRTVLSRRKAYNYAEVSYFLYFLLCKYILWSTISLSHFFFFLLSDLL